jgi:hypothetical protein
LKRKISLWKPQVLLPISAKIEKKNRPCFSGGCSPSIQWMLIDFSSSSYLVLSVRIKLDCKKQEIQVMVA